MGTGADTGYTFPYRAPDKGGKLVLRGVAEVEWRSGGGTDQFITSTCVVDGPWDECDHVVYWVTGDQRAVCGGALRVAQELEARRPAPRRLCAIQ